MKTNSFATSVKNELASNSYDSLAKKKAILSAYIRANGVMIIRNRVTLLSLKTENAKIAKFIYSLLKELYPLDISFSYSKKSTRNNKNVYSIDLGSHVNEIIDDLHIDFLEGKISKDIAYDEDTIIGYLIGSFLATGSVNSPETSNYHLEMAFNNENYAKWMLHLFNKLKNINITPKMINRKAKTVIYIKRSDQIADFLALLGAMEQVLEFENVRINRDFVNNSNRLTNLDTANMSKTFEAGKRQADEIKYLIKKIGLEKIGKEKTQLAIKYRLDNLSMPLEEIASNMSVEMGVNITKSNVNHIFRAIHDKYIKEK